MKRLFLCSAVLLCAAVFAPALRADVKTVQKTTFKVEGLLGAFLNRAAGGDNGLTTTTSIKGNRMSRVTGTTGEIIDLTEEKVYRVDLKKKEYTVVTFAEMRAELEKAKAEMAKRQEQMNAQDKAEAQQAAKQLEFDIDVKQTGETQAMAGQNARKAILTIAMREKGKKLEESGGMVMTSTMWLAPRVAALDEIADFNMKYFKAVYGGVFSGMDMQQVNALSAMFPGFGSLQERSATEMRKLQGTPLATTTVIESVKCAEQMANAPKAGGGGGLGGMLAARMMRGQSQQRTTTLTTTSETQSIAPTASADDVAIPAGFKEKKK
jgi:hypothetical protein